MSWFCISTCLGGAVNLCSFFLRFPINMETESFLIIICMAPLAHSIQWFSRNLSARLSRDSLRACVPPSSMVIDPVWPPGCWCWCWGSRPPHHWCLSLLMAHPPQLPGKKMLAVQILSLWQMKAAVPVGVHEFHSPSNFGCGPGRHRGSCDWKNSKAGN